ncbi:MAG: DUF3999 family protein [bacterium]
MNKLRMNTGKIGLLVCCFSVAAFAGNEAFSHSASVQTPPITREELAELILPQPIYAVTREDLSDVRLVRSDGTTPIPFLIECVTTKRCDFTRESRSLRIHKVEELDGQKLQMILRREEPEDATLLPLSGLVIHTPLRDFERKIKVDASADGETWKTVVESARIFDVSNFADFRVKEIELPFVDQRYLRLTVDPIISPGAPLTTTVRTSEDKGGTIQNIDRQFVEQKRPFRIERVAGWIKKESWVQDARPLVKRDFRILGNEPDSELRHRFPKASLIFFELGRAPLESVTLKSASRIFRVDCQLLIEREVTQPGEERWTRIASASISRLAFRDYLREDLHITCSESRAERYCLVMSAQSDAPDLAIVSCEGADYRAVFPCSIGDSVKLVCGNADKVFSVGHNSGQVRALLNSGIKPLRAQLGPLVQDKKAQGSSWKINTTWLLTMAVLLTACVLGVAVAVALKRMPPAE